MLAVVQPSHGVPSKEGVGWGGGVLGAWSKMCWGHGLGSTHKKRP